jgi:hypothetical protein
MRKQTEETNLKSSQAYKKLRILVEPWHFLLILYYTGVYHKVDAMLGIIDHRQKLAFFGGAQDFFRVSCRTQE